MYQPSSADYPEYYKFYIKKVLGTPILEGLESSAKGIVKHFQDLPSDKHNFAYEIGKWTPKDMLLHITDTERVFAYRVLRILRNDGLDLKGFDQDVFVEASQANLLDMKFLIDDFKAVRKSTISLFRNLTNHDLSKKGFVEGNAISVGAIGLILLGHEMHHVNILKERYI